MIFLLSACSLSNLDWNECETTAECRDAFGFGSVCNPDGMCEDVVPPARCERTIPADLFQDLDAYRDRILLGSTYERSESEADVKSFELAINQINEPDKGGVDGRLFAFVSCSNEADAAFDDLSAEEANTTTALFLADTLGAPAILGPSYSSTTLAAFNEVEELGTLVISPSATSPELTTREAGAHSDVDPGRLWRTAPPDAGQGRAIALDLMARGVTNLGIVYEDSSYGQGLAQVVYDEFEGQRTQYEFVSGNGTSRDEKVTEAGGGGHSEVLFISSDKADVRGFLFAASALGSYDTMPIFLADAAYDLQVFADTRSAAQDLFPNIRGTVPATPGGGVYDAFAVSYATAYDGQSAADSAYTAYAYDAAWLVMSGAAWSVFRGDEEGRVTGVGIAKGIRQMSDGTAVEIRPNSWSAIVARFQSGESVDVEGASGPLDYDPVTEEVAALIDVWTVNDRGDAFTTECRFDPAGVDTAPPDCLPE